MCDRIGQLEIDIACLAETNTYCQHPKGEVFLKTTNKRDWRHSHISTSETEIEWTGLYKPRGTVIITLQPFSSDITTSDSDPHRLCRWSYISIKERYNNNITIKSAYHIY